MPVMNLTETRIREIELGSGIWRDEQIRGLMVVSHKTTKTYAVQGDVRRNGRHIRTVRVKIDRVDRIGLREARRRARELMSQIQSGIETQPRSPTKLASRLSKLWKSTYPKGRLGLRQKKATDTISITNSLGSAEEP
jgi:hypothetical protein